LGKIAQLGCAVLTNNELNDTLYCSFISHQKETCMYLPFSILVLRVLQAVCTLLFLREVAKYSAYMNALYPKPKKNYSIRAFFNRILFKRTKIKPLPNTMYIVTNRKTSNQTTHIDKPFYHYFNNEDMHTANLSTLNINFTVRSYLGVLHENRISPTSPLMDVSFGASFRVDTDKISVFLNDHERTFNERFITSFCDRRIREFLTSSVIDLHKRDWVNALNKTMEAALATLGIKLQVLNPNEVNTVIW